MNRDDDGRRDFDFILGKWKIHNSRLKLRLQNCTEWQEFEARHEGRPTLGGLGNVDSFSVATFPLDGRPLEGMSIRTFDPRTRLWSIWWLDDRSFHVQPPVAGRFEGARGEFFGDEIIDGRPTRVRFIWSDVDTPSPRWEQAFSIDGGKTWETNWRSVLTRA
ncbi:MAG TPA: hypothetical protein VKE22_06755 [Haliangiales bacterium]|nr:hypothetical protein [Haliangiales bacterium]